MTLQEFFYIYAIITMTIYILSVVAIILALLYLKRRFTEISSKVELRVNNVKNFVTHPSVFVGIIGRILLMRALGQITKIFRR